MKQIKIAGYGKNKYEIEGVINTAHKNIEINFKGQIGDTPVAIQALAKKMRLLKKSGEEELEPDKKIGKGKVDIDVTNIDITKIEMVKQEEIKKDPNKKNRWPADIFDDLPLKK